MGTGGATSPTLPGGQPVVPKPQGGQHNVTPTDNQQERQTQAGYAATNAAADAKNAHKLEWHVGPDGKPHQFDTVTGKYIDGFNPNHTGVTAGGPSLGGPSTAMTQYEAAQIKMQQAQLAAQVKQQAAAEKLGASTLIENSNNQYRADRLKDYYGTLNGRAFDSPKGAPMAEMSPESQTMKDAYKLTGQPDPWANAHGANYAGYTGSAFSNAQHPNLVGPGEQPGVPAATGTGSHIPLPPGQQAPSGGIAGPPQVAGGGEQTGGSNFEMNGPRPGMHPAISSLFDAVNALANHPDFSRAPIPQQTSQSGVPIAASMATGGTVPGAPGEPQVIEAHGGETVTPQGMTPPSGLPVMQGFSPTQDQSGAQPMGDFQSMFNNWHAQVHAGGEVGQPGGTSPSGPVGQIPIGQASGPGGSPPIGQGVNPAPYNAPGARGTNPSPFNAPGDRGANPSPPIGQQPQPQPTTFSPQLIHPAAQTFQAGPGVMNHLPYGPELTGLGGMGAGMTANGTPIPLSGWQLANMDPSSIADYQSYVGSVAGWNPADMRQMGTSATQGGAPSLGAPRTFAPTAYQGGPGGG